MKKEIEVKAHLKNTDNVLESIRSLGCTLSEPIRQIDTVYTKIVGNVENYLKNDHFVRIREKSDGRFIFTVKKPLSKVVLTKAEHETEVKNAVELEQALFLMGYQIANKVIKSRRTAQFKEFEICIDNVEKLGHFIEVEKMSDGDVDTVRKELNEFLSSLGVSAEDETHKGYDIMAIELTN
ncbi:MAG: putative Adenylyl cyclase CyaB [Candidatus Paceibacter sp.]|jgi:adenylate cyclase class 2|nr:putative Adenylyl cyclase CyaB [Candidatus Paceibacter sp.]